MASPRDSSFVLRRPGIESGYRVKRRLRFVDSTTLAVRVLGFPVGMCLWFAFGFRLAAMFGDTWFIVALFALFLAAVYVVDTTIVVVLRVIFRASGLMTGEEAAYFPLNIGKRSVDPWPLAWQESIELE